VRVLGLDEIRLFAFFLVLARTGALFAVAPILSSGFIPLRVRGMLAAGLSASLVWLGFPPEVPPPASASVVCAFLAQEALVGLAIGLVARLAFAAVEFGAQVAGLQMGLGIAAAMDPRMEREVSVLSPFLFALAGLLFVAMGGVGIFFEAFARNLTEVPPGRALVGASLAGGLVHISGEVFTLGLSFVAPVVAAVFAAQVALGVLVRAVPPVNALFLEFPLQVLVGLSALALSLPHWGPAVARALAGSLEILRDLAPLVR
jgi:flagellar biosynthetic protein FliR